VHNSFHVHSETSDEQFSCGTNRYTSGYRRFVDRIGLSRVIRGVMEVHKTGAGFDKTEIAETTLEAGKL
jgi:hypothetical protein